MRDIFIDELVILARSNPQIALVVGDLGYSVVNKFSDEFPDRFLNAGVAEQNMASLAAGLASEGYHVFIYSIANFSTFRCAEQIRNDIDYHKFPVTIVSVGGGLAYGALGYSHHAVQDYALMRSFPNMVLATPGDEMEVRAVVQYLVRNPTPSYLRLGKLNACNFQRCLPKVEIGRWLKIKDAANSCALISTGGALDFAFRLSCSEEFSKFGLYTLPLWSMATKANQAAQLAKFSKVITVEDHFADGGFGSWMLEASLLNENLQCKINIKALDPIVSTTVGDQVTLNEIGGLICK